jgi:hypothetical protein
MTGDGRPLPGRLRAALLRELARIELLLQQIRNVSTTLRQPAFEFKLGFSAFGLAG